MKGYISADIEGIARISHWNEARKTHADYQEFRDLMTREVVAVCEGVIAAGVRVRYSSRMLADRGATSSARLLRKIS